MELEEKTYIEMVLEYVSGLSLEDKSLEWLKANKKKISRSIANCERSAQKLREFIIDECDGRDITSELVKEKKGELVEAIQLEAELEKIVVKRLDEEIAKRLETSNN